MPRALPACVPLPPMLRPAASSSSSMLADLLDRHDQADALRRKHVAPVGDQLLVGLADVADLAVEVEQAERIDVAVLLAKRGVPVDLVGQRVPGEADGRDADVAQAQDVGPFLPQPFDRFVAVRAFPQVGLGVHHRQPVAVVILPRDLGVAEGLAGRDGVAVGEHAMLVELVIIVAEDAVLLQPVVEEPLIFLAGHAVIEQVLVHAAVDPPAVIEVERQEAHLVEHFGAADRGRDCRRDNIPTIPTG